MAPPSVNNSAAASRASSAANCEMKSAKGHSNNYPNLIILSMLRSPYPR